MKHNEIQTDIVIFGYVFTNALRAEVVMSVFVMSEVIKARSWYKAAVTSSFTQCEKLKYIQYLNPLTHIAEV